MKHLLPVLSVGLQVARAHNDASTTPFRADLDWSPWHGNGLYTLTITARSADDGDHIYEIDLFDDGRVETNLLALESDYGESLMCRPVGHYRTLVVFVDFGNTIVTQEMALDALKTAAERANQWHADYAAEHGLSEPLITLELTGAYMPPPPPAPGEFLTAEQIQSRTGFDVMDFDLVAQVDLDNDETLAQSWGGTGFRAFRLSTQRAGRREPVHDSEQPVHNSRVHTGRYVDRLAVRP